MSETADPPQPQVSEVAPVGSMNESPGSTTEHEPSFRAFWAGLPVDWKNLIVTVAGTVIGGILLAMVLALAVIVTRWFREPGNGLPWQHGPSSVPEALLQVGGAIVAALLLMFGGIGRKKGDSLKFTLLLVSAALYVEAVLVLLGLALRLK